MKKKWPPNDPLAKLLCLHAKLAQGKITQAQFDACFARLKRLADKQPPDNTRTARTR